MIAVSGWMDSFLMSAAMAISGCPRTYQRQAVFGFMAFDFLASFAPINYTGPGEVIVPLAFALSLVLVYFGKKRPALYALIPLLCSLDNLLTPSDASFQFWPAALDGLASALVAWAGFSLGSLVLDRVKAGAA